MAKRLGLLRELVPTAARIAVLVNPTNLGRAVLTRSEIEPAAQALGLQVQFYEASSNPEIDTALAAIVREQPDALFVSSDTFFTGHRVQLISLAARYVLPASYSVREFVEAGGLMSMAPTSPTHSGKSAFIPAASLGARSRRICPVMQASKFELVINAMTAKLLGLTVPASLLATADELIQ
jgi:putative ABC transport system substrate-binding protein